MGTSVALAVCVSWSRDSTAKATITITWALGRSGVRRWAEANGRRKAEVFEQAARLLMNQAGRHLRQEGQQLLYLLDSTSITLKGPGFDAWDTGQQHTQYPRYQLHVLYAAHEQVPLQQSSPLPTSMTLRKASAAD